MDKVLITGANRGLGYELLKIYSSHNNMTFPLVRSEESARLLSSEFINCTRLGSLQKMSSGEFLNRNFSYSYRMAKAAQNMFTICLSQELEESRIAVCAIHPGQLLTRGRSTDANTDPATAALNIYEWTKEVDINSTGQYVQPMVGELPW